MKRIALISSIAALAFAACSNNPLPSAEAPVDAGSSELIPSVCLICPPPVISPVTPGSLDTSFRGLRLSGTGKILTIYGSSDVMGMATQPDGKILIAGGDNRYTAWLVRYTASGLEDTTFDGDGWVGLRTYAFGYEPGGPVAVQPDGKIVVGSARKLLATGKYNDASSEILNTFGAHRFNPNGAQDTGFTNPPSNTFGNFVFNLPSLDQRLRYETPAMALQSDGKIVLASRPNVYLNSRQISAPIVVTRHNANGSTDKTFGSNGYVSTVTYPGHFSYVTSMAIQTDGKIVIAGYDTPTDGSTSDFAIARYNTNGTPDTSFDIDGIARVGFVGYSNDYAKAVKIQSDGKIVVAGHSNIGAWGDNNFTLARLNTNGSLDTGFGNNGLVSTTFASISADRANDMTIQADGKIVVVGTTKNGFDSDFGLARYNTNGSLDTTFGYGGLVTTSFGTSYLGDSATNVVLQNGKIVVAGYTSDSYDRTLVMARYNP
jgi:uncharacterized delta-60 repeat protein